MALARRRIALASIVAGLGASSTALAQPLPPLPPAAAERPAPRVEAPTGLPQGAPRSTGPLSLLVLISNQPDPADRMLRRVAIREEATHPDYFRQFGGGSLSATALVNCDTRQFQLESFEMFSRNNLAGGVATQFGRRSSWQTPAPDTVLGRTVSLACGSRPVAAAPPPRSAAQESPPAALRPGPATPVAPPKAAPTPPPPPAPRKSAGAWPGAAQVAAADTEVLAREVRDRIARDPAVLADGLTAEIVRATVNGRVYHRVLVKGFDSGAAADGFCRAMAARKQDCFVRR